MPGRGQQGDRGEGAWALEHLGRLLFLRTLAQRHGHAREAVCRLRVHREAALADAGVGGGALRGRNRWHGRQPDRREGVELGHRLHDSLHVSDLRHPPVAAAAPRADLAACSWVHADRSGGSDAANPALASAKPSGGGRQHLWVRLRICLGDWGCGIVHLPEGPARDQCHHKPLRAVSHGPRYWHGDDHAGWRGALALEYVGAPVPARLDHLLGRGAAYQRLCLGHGCRIGRRLQVPHAGLCHGLQLLPHRHHPHAADTCRRLPGARELGADGLCAGASCRCGRRGPAGIGLQQRHGLKRIGRRLKLSRVHLH
mmetsp:Transcript_84653/g.218188  ORF Transcript_84653/g.218188 Transcript_84653/m.218188 type:complete len:313 (-) Transcript_84653:420-1358(-)